jgi:hypothetical protein
VGADEEESYFVRWWMREGRFFLVIDRSCLLRS